MKVRQLKGLPVDCDVLEKRINLHNIEIHDEMILEQAKENLIVVQDQWKTLKEQGHEMREKYLFDHYNKAIPEEDLNDKHKTKIMWSVSKQMKSKYSF